MKKNYGNQSRAFAEIVSLDAWHQSFDKENPKVSLHADIVFREGRLGGESESTIQFKLKLKRAELVVIVPDLEPLQIDPRSVARDGISFKGSKTLTVKSESDAHARAIAGGNISASKIDVNIEACGGIAASVNESKLLEAKSEISEMQVLQTKNADGNYTWDIRPNFSNTLEGRPWNPDELPRLKLIDTRLDRSKGIAPVVHLEVRCLREDLEISDVQIKDKDIWAKISSNLSKRNNVIAAESYIRERLISEDLPFGNLTDDYSSLVLAKIVATSTEEIK